MFASLFQQEEQYAGKPNLNYKNNQNNQNKMNQIQSSRVNSIISCEPAHTNSLLKLPIPIQYKQSQCVFQWHTLNPNRQIINPDIFQRSDSKRSCKSSSFQCTPLQYGIYLIGRVILDRNGTMDIVKQTKYGPVSLQNQITNYMMHVEVFNVRIVINKNNLVVGTVKIQKYYQGTSKQVKINLIIEFDELKFQLKIDKNLALAANGSILKFYDKQQQCLGVSMYHQHSQFMQKLKKIKIFTHFGLYIKIHFQSRLVRDSFLFLLMKSCGIQIPQLGLSQDELPKIKIKPAHSGINSQISVDVKKSHITNKNKQVDEEFYRLLYQPSQFGGLNGDQISFDAADAQFLFASVKKSDIRKSILQTIIKQSAIFSKQNPKQAEKERSNSKNKKSAQLQYKSNNFIQVSPPIDRKSFQKQRKPISLEKIYKPNCQWFRNHSSGSFNTVNKQNQLRTTIMRLTNQIDSLLKENRKLVNQNKKLKDENMRLRFKQIKNTSKILRKGKQDGVYKMSHTQSNPNSPSQAFSSPKSPNHIINGLKKAEVAQQKQFKYQLSSKNVSYKQKQKLIQNPTNEVINLGTPGQTERNFTINFTSLSSISNNQLFKEQQNPKIQKKQKKINNTNNFNSARIFYPRQAKEKQSKSKDRQSPPSRPFIPVKNPGKSSENFHENSGIISRDYPPQTPSFKNTGQTLNFGTASTNFFNKYLTK